MPRAMSLVAYPNREFWAIVQKALRDGEVFLECDGPGAMSFRGQFYAWRRACEALPELAAKEGIDANELRRVSLVSAMGGLMLVPSITTPIVKMVAKALGEDAPKPSEAEASLARLKGLIRQGEEDAK